MSKKQTERTTHLGDRLQDVRPTGGIGIGVVGVFIAEDPGSPDELMKKGQIAFDFGFFWMKGQRLATGQANVKAYNRKLRDLIADKLKPSVIVSHQLPLDQAPDGYKKL